MTRTSKYKKNRYFHYQKEILNTISEPATFIDKKYRYVFVNSAFNKFYNKETQEIIGKTAEYLWGTENFENSIRPDMDKCLNGETVSIQFEGIIPGGEFKILELNYYPHRSAAGKIDGIISTSKDITEHKKAERALRENEARLEELNATKDKLFSVIGHDLQGPLSNIIGFSELIEKGYDNYTDEEIRQYNKIIYEMSQSVSGLLENLLTWARTQRNQIKVVPQVLSVHFIIEKCVGILTHSLLHKQIQFNNNVPPHTAIYADEEMITIVIRNLISNAIKFTNKGGTITVFEKTDAGEVVIGIKDSGIGIPEEKVAHLFQTSNKQPNTGTDGETGTGLGLIICKDFIAKNGGEIWVESTPGNGSVFYISLPEKKYEYNTPEIA
jgi:PAS domain S-box-containing protein